MARIATAVVLLPVLWGVCRLTPFPLFAAIFGLGIAVACGEALRLYEARGARPFKALGIVSCLAVSASFTRAEDRGALETILVGAFAAALAAGMARRDTASAMWDSAVATFVPVFFVGFGLAHLIGLRALGGERGADALFLLFLCVMTADTFAYYVGKTVGRRRIAPVVSPKKTWEGAVAGLAGSVIGAFVARVWFLPELPAAHAAPLGAVLFVAAFLGDLGESVMKRAAGRKDSSSLLPGHGGLLDRADSLILAAPTLYQYYRWFLVDLP